MSFKSVFVLSSTFLLGFATFFVGSLQSDDQVSKVLKREHGGWSVEYLQNSATLSQATAINADGAMVGFKEVPNENLTIFRSVYFYCGKNGDCKEVPMPKGFTNVEAAAISDTNLVVGRVTRPMGAEDGSLRAFVWDAKKSELQMLPRPEGDTLGDAHSISADGTRITGYSTGFERLRPTLWSWDAKKSEWTVTVLPTLHEYNPYLMSAQLIISPDGKTIVGCCTEQFLPDGTIDSALYVWREENGQWQRKLVTKEQLYVKAINNKGQIAGSVAAQHGRLPCVTTLDGQIKMLDFLEGDVGGEARGINEQSIIVGWSDDPHGPDGGPVPCSWTMEGKVTRIELSESGFGAVFGINEKGQIAGGAEVSYRAEAAKADDEEEVAMLAFRATKKSN